MIKVLVSGACGRMGSEVVRAVDASEDIQLIGAVDVIKIGEDIGSIALNKPNGIQVQNNLKEAVITLKPDVVVDFTDPNSVFTNAKLIFEAGARPVIGTTGLKEEEIAELKSISKSRNLSGMIAPNFTTGAVLMMMFAKMAAKYFDNAEIIEYHHNKKKDAPSGTAIKTAQLMAEAKENFTNGNIDDIELIKGSRGGTAPSDIHIHSVRMPGYMASQEVLFGSLGQILSIRHDSVDRKCYMDGVLMSIRYVCANNEFVYGLDNIL
ncbi:MAG: 4-hydroxy-tetrahydrodipicolinate reductase [Candidatus Gastranaerophilales bacterium]|nr:4-hydroxy-tetrahydrodipicolinate reductase [Candidatus Gastranaerophilales bacterium]